MIRVILTVLFVLPLPVLALDYGKVARELEATSKDTTVKKVAVLPFEDLDDQSSSLGRAVQEELTFAMVRETKFTVVERSLVDRALNELQFQATGVIDAASAKQLGKGIGAEAVVTGTIQRDGGGYRLIARLIRTDTFTILAVAQATSTERTQLKKDETAAKQPPPAKTFLALDVFGGLSSADLSIGYGKPGGIYPAVNSSQVGVPGPNVQYTMIEFDNLSIKEEIPPWGLRLRLANGGSAVFSAGFEIMYQNISVPSQKATVVYNDSAKAQVNLNDTYLKLKTYQINIHLLFDLTKIAGFAQPHFTLLAGGMLGGTIGILNSQVIQYYNVTSEQFGPTANELGSGMQAAAILTGLLHLTDHFSLLLEGRYFGTFVEFNRDGELSGFLLSEDTTITMSGFQAFAGVCLRWQ